MTELPEGIRLLLIAGLELCGAVLNGETYDQLLAAAERMRLLAGEHLEIGD